MQRGGYPWHSGVSSNGEVASALAEAEPRSFWLAGLPAQEPHEELARSVEADLCIVGAGFMGLWAAVEAKRRDPSRDVVVLEAQTAGFGASGRNGGFVSSSLTHGIGNGLARFADEMPLLERLGRENFRDLGRDLGDLGISCDYEGTGSMHAAVAPHEPPALADEAALLRRYGYEVELFPDAASIQAEIASPLYRAGLWLRDGALVDPGKLVRGLLAAAVALGVRVHERSPVVRIDRDSDGSLLTRTAHGAVRAPRVILATNAFPPLVKAIRRYVVPVYDYVLVSEPLDPGQRQALGWRRRQGVSDGGNQFHYYRLTPDDRILYGGFDAVYRFRGPVRDDLDRDAATFERLAGHFFQTFPMLRGLRFTHAWGGAIDTCSRFSAFFGSAYEGRLAYAVGYTGLGVAATRFGAQATLDMVDGRDSEVLGTRYATTKPTAFPPEPLRTLVIQFTRNRMAAADRNGGKRGFWLRSLDRLGLGFDS